MHKDLENFSNKIRRGLELTYQRLIEHKKQINGKLVVYRDGEIVHLDPHELPPDMVPGKTYTRQSPPLGVEEPNPDGEDPKD